MNGSTWHVKDLDTKVKDQKERNSSREMSGEANDLDVYAVNTVLDERTLMTHGQE